MRRCQRGPNGLPRVRLPAARGRPGARQLRFGLGHLPGACVDAGALCTSERDEVVGVRGLCRALHPVPALERLVVTSLVHQAERAYE